MIPHYIDPVEIVEIYDRARDAALARDPADLRGALVAGLVAVALAYRPERVRERRRTTWPRPR